MLEEFQRSLVVAEKSLEQMTASLPENTSPQNIDLMKTIFFLFLVMYNFLFTHINIY